MLATLFDFRLESVRVVEFGFVLSVMVRGLDLGGNGEGEQVDGMVKNTYQKRGA